MFSRLDTVILRVRDLPATRQWYAATLGLHAVYEDAAQGLAVLGLDGGASMTLWAVPAGEAVGPSSTYPIFAVADAAAAHPQLNSGVRRTSDPVIRMRSRHAWIVAVAAGTASLGRPAVGQPHGSGDATARAAAVLDSMLQSDGPAWQRARSPHFLLFAERGARPRYSPRALLESLEAAYEHAARLLGVVPAAHPPVPVLVTRSRVRFARFLGASGKGVTNVGGAPQMDFIILVSNDSVRAYTRHEVMHFVARRAWGPAAALWVTEGLAAWADGRCQDASVLAVARDLLRAEPGLTASALAARFVERTRRDAADRARDYTLAGSLVGAVFDRGGSAGVRDLWRGGVPTGSGALWGADTLTAPWRAFVERAAAREPGLTPEALARFGCG